MERWLGKYSEGAYALLRIVTGLLFACHGAQKLFGFLAEPGKEPVAFMSKMGLAGAIELVGGLLIAFGLFTGFAAFLSSGLMAVAYFQAHFPKGFWPIQNKGELAVVYCFLFLYMACRGSGRFSLGRALNLERR